MESRLKGDLLISQLLTDMKLRFLLSTLVFILSPFFLLSQTDSIPIAPGNLIWQESDSTEQTPTAKFQSSQIWILLDGKLLESPYKRDSILHLMANNPQLIAHIDTLPKWKAESILGKQRKGTLLALTTYQASYKIRPWLQYRTELSLNWIGRRPEMVSSTDWLRIANEASSNDGLPALYPNGIESPVDWQKEVFHPALSQSHQLALFGNGKFWQERYLSISALNQASPVAQGQYNRYQSRIKLKRHRSNGHFWGINLNGTYSQQKDYLPLLGTREGLVFHTLLAPPSKLPQESLLIFPSQNASSPIFQPSLYAERRQQQLDQQVLSGKVFYDIVHDGNWLVNNSISFQHWQSQHYLQFPDLSSDNTLVRLENSRLQSVQHQIRLAYNADPFLNHRLSFSQSFRQEYFFWEWSSEPITGPNRSQWRSYHNIFAFEYQNSRNLPELAGGLEWAMSDRMRPSKQMAFFPSLSMKWRLPFRWGYHNPLIDASWGISGNDGSTLITQLTSLQQQQPFFQEDNQFLSSNPDWERQQNVNLGISSYLISNLSLGLALYQNRTDNLWVALPNENQILVWQNLASVQNKGIEANLSYEVRRLLLNNLRFNTDITYQYNQNELLSSGSETPLTIPFSGQLGALKAGEPLGSIWGYETNGLYQEGENFEIEPSKQAGDIKLVDRNGDGIISEADQHIIARTMPVHSFTSSLNFYYKAFTLSMQWYGQGGHEIVNYQRLYGLDQINGNTNLFAAAINRWTPENTETNIPRATYNSENRITDRLVESGDFLRLKQLKFNWDLIVQKPSRRDRPFYEIDIYLSAQNLWLISKYSGYDPEVYLNGAPFYLGVDRGAYPRPRTLSLGLNLQW